MLREKNTPNRSSAIKKTVSGEDARRKREELSNSIRKTKREESLAKRREITEPSWAAQHTQDLQQKQPQISQIVATIEHLPEYVRQILSTDINLILGGIVGIRKLLSIGMKQKKKTVLNQNQKKKNRKKSSN